MGIDAHRMRGARLGTNPNSFHPIWCRPAREIEIFRQPSIGLYRGRGSDF